MHPSHLSRRTFLAAGLGATAGGALVGLRPLAAAAPERKPLPRFGFTTYQWGKDWDVPTLIENCAKAEALGVEVRTSIKHAHGIELALNAAARRTIRQRFKDSPVALVGLASGERFDALEPAKVKAGIEAAKQYLQLSHDLGATGVRVFGNDFHKEVPREQTIAQVAKALNEVGKFAATLGQEVRLEAHGSIGELPSIRAIMDQVTEPSVRVKLNSDARDAKGEGFEANFNLVKGLLGQTIHTHDFKDPKFPNQLQIDLLVRMGWSGWLLLEATGSVPDPVAAMKEQREACALMIRKAT